MNELWSVAGSLVVLPALGGLLGIAGKAKGDLKAPFWIVYLWCLGLGAAVVYLPRV